MGAYPRDTGSNPVEGIGHFFPHTVSSIFRTSFSDTHTHKKKNRWTERSENTSKDHVLLCSLDQLALGKATLQQNWSLSIDPELVSPTSWLCCSTVDDFNKDIQHSFLRDVEKETANNIAFPQKPPEEGPCQTETVDRDAMQARLLVLDDVCSETFGLVCQLVQNTIHSYYRKRGSTSHSTSHSSYNPE